jgi:hypothetical protein
MITKRENSEITQITLGDGDVLISSVVCEGDKGLAITDNPNGKKPVGELYPELQGEATTCISTKGVEIYFRGQDDINRLINDFSNLIDRPRVVCLCGSTRYWEHFRDHGLRFTLEGKIVLSIGICAPDSMVLANPVTREGKEQKTRLDELHKRKIDLADEVFVLDVDGYIGSSTRGEIEYAMKTGKPVVYLSQTKD